MTDEHRDYVYIERLTAAEKILEWLQDRVWRGPGNHHERIHKLEDSNGDRVHEIELLKADVDRIERTLGLNGYGEKNITNDLRDAISTIAKIKDGIISVSEFRGMLVEVADIAKRITSIEKQHEDFDMRSWQIWMVVISVTISTVLGYVLGLVLK